jgi:hypothetical protein
VGFILCLVHVHPKANTICRESGAPVASSIILEPTTAETETRIKQQWWRQIWNPAIFEKYPNLKSIVMFEEAKVEDGHWKDWRITANASVRAAFVADLQNGLSSRIVWASELTYLTNGTVTMKQ